MTHFDVCKVVNFSKGLPTLLKASLRKLVAILMPAERISGFHPLGKSWDLKGFGSIWRTTVMFFTIGIPITKNYGDGMYRKLTSS